MLIYIQNVSFKVIWNKRKSVVKNTNVDSFDRSRSSIPFSVYSHLQVYLKNSLIVGKLLPNISLIIVCTRNFERLTTKSCIQTSYKKYKETCQSLSKRQKRRLKWRATGLDVSDHGIDTTIRSDKGLTLETSAFLIFHGYPIYLFIYILPYYIYIY